MSNLSHRMDSRSSSEFHKDIQQGTHKENILAQLFEAHCLFNGIDIQIQANSNGRDGKPIKGDFVSGADFLVTYDGKPLYVEINSCGILTKVTFVKYRLETCIRNNYHLLLFIGTGVNKNTPIELVEKTLLESPDLQYCWLTPLHIKTILECEDLKPGVGFGGKPTIMVLSKDFDRFFTFKRIDKD
jgi:hypothetical protein